MKDWPSLVVHFPEGAPESLHELVSALLDPDEVAAIEERSAAEWLVSFRHPAARDAAVHDIDVFVGNQGVSAAPVDVSDDDWARRSQAGLGAIRAGRFVIAPPWVADDSAADGTIRLIIEPSMGFGSGHHATTRLCLQALQALDVAGARVLDIGTGSGILAIAAAKLGASRVIGVDNDPDALDAARTDAGRNALADRVQFVLSDFRTAAESPADIVLANITGAVLAAHAADIMACVVPGGHAILSGITTGEAADVEAAFGSRATPVARADEDGWVGLVYRAA